MVVPEIILHIFKLMASVTYFRRHWELKHFQQFDHDLKILHLMDVVRPDACTWHSSHSSLLFQVNQRVPSIHMEESLVCSQLLPELWAAASAPKTKQQPLLPLLCSCEQQQDSGCEWDQFTRRERGGGRSKGPQSSVLGGHKHGRLRCKHG